MARTPSHDVEPSVGAPVAPTRVSSRLPGYLTLIIGITLVGVGLAITRPYLSLFLTDVVHTTPVELGAFMCINGIGGIVASTWLGKMSDNHTPKKDIMLVSCLCAGIGYASFVLLHNYFVLLIVSTLLLGVGTSAFPQMFAYARESALSAGGGDATMAISTLRSFFSLAWVMGPLFGAWCLSSLGYNGLFISTGIIFILVLGLVLFGLRRRPTNGHHRASPARLLSTLKRRDVLLSSISFIAASTASSINGMYMPLFVHQTLHAPERVVGWVFSLSAGLEIPIMLALGAVAVRIGKRVLLLAGTVCGILYYTGSVFAHATWQVLMLQLLCAVFISINASIGMSYFQDFIPESTGMATTLFSNTNNIGSVAGSLVGGAIAQAFGFRSVYWCCIGLGLVTYVFLWSARTPRSRVSTNVSDVQA